MVEAGWTRPLLVWHRRVGNAVNSLCHTISMICFEYTCMYRRIFSLSQCCIAAAPRLYYYYIIFFSYILFRQAI